MDSLVRLIQDPAALWGLVGVVVTQLLNWAVSWRRARLESDAERNKTRLEERRLEAAEEDAAYQRLRGLVDTLQAQLQQFRRDLEEERDLRRKAEERVRKAEDHVVALRRDVFTLRDALVRAGVTLPPGLSSAGAPV